MNEWIEFNSSWREFDLQGLNKPGTLVEVQYKNYWDEAEKTLTRQFLIGDINDSRGVCDDCTEFDRDATVIKYKVVWVSENK